jgi:hypothetical protein
VDPVCTDGHCVLSWLQGKRFSYSAKLSLLAWVSLLARLVTGKHWPEGWSGVEVDLYLKLLGNLVEMLLEEESWSLENNDLLKVIAADFHVTSNNYTG